MTLLESTITARDADGPEAIRIRRTAQVHAIPWRRGGQSGGRLLGRVDADAGVAHFLDRHRCRQQHRICRHAPQQARRQPACKACRAALGPELTRRVGGAVEASVGVARVQGVGLDGRLDLRTAVSVAFQRQNAHAYPSPHRMGR